MTASPERLEEIEDRLAALDRLKRKYGQTLAEVIAFGEDARQKLNEIENRDAILVELRARLAAVRRCISGGGGGFEVADSRSCPVGEAGGGADQ